MQKKFFLLSLLIITPLYSAEESASASYNSEAGAVVQQSKPETDFLTAMKQYRNSWIASNQDNEKVSFSSDQGGGEITYYFRNNSLTVYGLASGQKNIKFEKNCQYHYLIALLGQFSVGAN